MKESGGDEPEPGGRGWRVMAGITIGVVVGLAIAAIVASRIEHFPGPLQVSLPPGIGEPTASAAPTAAPDVEASITAPLTGAPDGGEPAVAVILDEMLRDPASPWVVVNKARPLEPEHWAPPELVTLSGVPGGAGQQMTPDAGEALTEMAQAAADAGAGFSVSTAYRSRGEQAGIHRDYVSRWGRERADRFSARPGHSEHQTGLAVDVYDTEDCRLRVCFGDSDAGRWIAAHAHEYGYVVRYPLDREHITGFRYEPWHLRYVGRELAADMQTQGIDTLEEFFGLPPAPDYP